MIALAPGSLRYAALALVLAGCTEREPLGTQSGAFEPTSGPEPTGGEQPTGGTGGITEGSVTETGGEAPTREVCERYLDCIAVATPEALPGAQMGFGPNGSCWDGPPASEQCIAACATGLDALRLANLDIAQCVDCLDAAGCDGDLACFEGLCVEGAGVGVSGEFLLAVSTVVSPDLPLQFIATNTLSMMDGQMWLHTELQPLALDQGQVTTPRTPVGEPLVFDSVAVVDGAFEFDAGVVELAGATNPITGGDMVASLVLTGSLQSDDFYCGTVDGELESPLKAQLAGSTFAAVRVASLADLPLDVAINCAGETVTDP